jgi:perosamine synthetase
MLVTADDELAALALSERNQGRGALGAWLDHERLGFNYRMDEMSAALGASQFRRLDSILAKREAVARMYDRRLKGVDGVETPRVEPHARMSWFVYVVTLPDDVARDAVIAALARNGIPARAYFTPVHLQPYVRAACGSAEGQLPVTEAVARRTLALPFHNRITADEIDLVASELERAIASVRGN